MIRVTVEFLPFGKNNHPDRAKIGRLDIANDGTGDGEIGNYNVTVYKRDDTLSNVLKKGRVKEYQRQILPVWVLVKRALESVGF